MIKRLFLTMTILFTFLGLSDKIGYAAYDPLADACSGNGSGSAACIESAPSSLNDNPVTDTTQKIVNIVSVIVGAAAVVVIIVAGITMTTSQGDSGKIKSSRDAIIYATVGLVVTALARTIVIFVINRT